jgi:hypothetical protein
MLVTVDDLEEEVEDLGEYRDIAGNLLSQIRKEGRWNPLRPTYAPDYIINHEHIEEKGKWSTEGKIVDRLVEMQWKSDIVRFDEAQDIRQAEGKELLSKTVHLNTRCFKPSTRCTRSNDRCKVECSETRCQGDAPRQVALTYVDVC